MVAYVDDMRMTEVMGRKIPFKRFDGIDYNFWSFIPENIEEHLKQLRETEIYDDDIWISTYPRSGTNWTHEIVYMLQNGDSTYQKTLFELVDMYPKEKILEFKRPRIFASHFPLKYSPRQLSERGRVICVFRNPKDLLVSFHSFLSKVKFADYNGSINEFIDIFLDGQLPGGSWFDHVLQWERDLADNKLPSVLTLFYEDMKQDLLSHVEKIAEFLKIPSNPDLFKAIADKCTFSKMNEEKQTNIPPAVVKCTRVEGLNYLYRKGEIGNWKKWFTVAQNERFDRIYEEKMKDSKLKFIFSAGEISK